MYTPFYSPDQIDWLDGLNPLAVPCYRETTNPFVYRALQQPTMVQLRQALEAGQYEAAIYAAPDEPYATVGGGATYDSIPNLPAGSWIYGLSVSSQQGQGCKIQITLPNGATLFSTSPTSLSFGNARPHFFSRPLGIPDGGPVRLRVINLSAAANRCQLAIWVAQP